ncbi:unnamed protein product [Closterium sp. NIES-53]
MLLHSLLRFLLHSFRVHCLPSALCPLPSAVPSPPSIPRANGCRRQSSTALAAAARQSASVNASQRQSTPVNASPRHRCHRCHYGTVFSGSLLLFLSPPFTSPTTPAPSFTPLLSFHSPSSHLTLSPTSPSSRRAASSALTSPPLPVVANPKNYRSRYWYSPQITAAHRTAPQRTACTAAHHMVPQRTARHRSAAHGFPSGVDFSAVVIFLPFSDGSRSNKGQCKGEHVESELQLRNQPVWRSVCHGMHKPAANQSHATCNRLTLCVHASPGEWSAGSRGEERRLQQHGRQHRQSTPVKTSPHHSRPSLPLCSVCCTGLAVPRGEEVHGGAAVV